MKHYDIIIVGGGPAGLTASIYALRSGWKVLLFEGGVIGGQSATSFEVANYPGFELISGLDLAMKMHAQADKLGLETQYDLVEKIDCKNKVVSTKSSQFCADCIILAMGAKPKKLGIDKEDKFIGHGVHYCATCDGNFYNGKKVVVIGGGDTASEDALYLSNICDKVTMLVRSDKLKSQDVLRDRIQKLQKQQKINVLYKTNIVEIIEKDNVVSAIKVESNDKIKKIDSDAIFVAIGREPDTSLINGQIKLNKVGYVVSNDKMHTNIEGIFVAGDVREKEVRQIITACADGAIASVEANYYLNCKRG